MYYKMKRFNDFNRYDIDDLATKIRIKSGNHAEKCFRKCLNSLFNKAAKSTYLNELNSPDHSMRIAVAHDGTPTIFTASITERVVYIYTFKNNKVKRQCKNIP